MQTIEKIKEDIELGVEYCTLTIPVRVRMSAVNGAPLTFTSSIDDMGQIILTPTSVDVEFLDANTATNVSYNIPIEEQPNIIIDETDSYVEKELSINIEANMLVEDSNVDVSAVVDEIGQCVLFPASSKNSFITASINNSLNLVTEELEDIEYFGYKLKKDNSTWSVLDYCGNVVTTDIPTIAGAKIAACAEELRRLQELFNEEPDELDTTENSIEEEISKLTDSFTEKQGKIRCDTKHEFDTCVEILSAHYDTILTETDSNTFIITYQCTNGLNEEFDTSDVVDKFMRGEIEVFSDTGKPQPTYILIKELHSKGYDYYYDPESGAVVSYPVTGDLDD